MAAEIRSFAPSVPAGTLATAPVSLPLTMPDRIVQRIRIRVPPGPRGLMGFALTVSGGVIIPWGPAQWIIADDEIMEWDLTDYPTTGAWALLAYNTGQVAHTVYLQFSLYPLSARTDTGAWAPVTITA